MFRPRFAAPHLHLGKMYVALQRPEAAEREFRRAVEISPLSAEARNQFGKYLQENGRLAEAEVTAAGWRSQLDESERRAADYLLVTKEGFPAYLGGLFAAGLG